MTRQRKKFAHDAVRVDDVTQEQVQVAENRTRAILFNLRLLDHDLTRLAVSCYLQGARDMAETVINHPDCIQVGEPEPSDYQI